MTGRIKRARRAWYVEIYFATGRAFAHIFRLAWWGEKPVLEICTKCEGKGALLLPWLIACHPDEYANAVPCRFCAGLGRVAKTKGVT